jgi:hypothetical protein
MTLHLFLTEFLNIISPLHSITPIIINECPNFSFTSESFLLLLGILLVDNLPLQMCLIEFANILSMAYSGTPTVDHPFPDNGIWKFKFKVIKNVILPVLHVIPQEHFFIMTTLYADNIKIIHEIVAQDEYYIKTITEYSGVHVMHAWKGTYLIPNVSQVLIDNIVSLHLVTAEGWYYIRFESDGIIYTVITDLPPKNIINLYLFDNVNITPLNNFGLIPKSEVTKEVFSYINRYNIINLDKYSIFTNIPKKDFFND